MMISKLENSKIKNSFVKLIPSLWAVFFFSASCFLWTLTLTGIIGFFLMLSPSIDKEVVEYLTKGDFVKSVLFKIVGLFTGLVHVSILVTKQFLKNISKL